MSDNRRPLRVAEAIKEYVAQQLSTQAEDPRLASLVVTRVEVPPDLTMAWVYVRLLIGDADERERERSVRALTRAGGRFRGGIGRRLRLKRVPELRFQYDTGHDAERRVNELLEEIEREPKAQD